MNPPLLDPALAKTLLGILVSGLLGVIGGIATFFFEVDSGRRRFTWLGMLAMSVVAFVVGAIAGEFIPPGKNYYGLMMAAGVNAYPLFNFIQKRVARYIRNHSTK